MAEQPAKHGRDHCPGGADPIPCFTNPVFRGMITADTQLVEDGGPYTEILWDEWEISDDAFYDVNLSGGKVFSVDILQSGIYAITVRLVWAAEFTGNFRIIVNDWGDWPLAAFYDWNSSQGENGEAPAVTFVRTYPPPSFADLGSSLPDILVQVAQWSGGDVSLDSFGSSLEIARVGTLSGIA